MPLPISDDLETNLYSLLKGLAEFPYAQVCRHWVALEILQVLEASGYELNVELVKAFCDSSAGDVKAIEILTEKLGE